MRYTQPATMPAAEMRPDTRHEIRDRPAAWSDTEQVTICSAYAVLLDAQNNGIRANKAELCRATVPALDNRSRGSYEFKMCNISAALADAGNDYVTGYKPRSGYQRSLLGILHTLRPDLVPHFEESKT